jgi:hypothetical protein
MDRNNVEAENLILMPFELKEINEKEYEFFFIKSDLLSIYPNSQNSEFQKTVTSSA